MQHVLGALWLLGLFAAAPVLRSRETPYAFADRLRDALILGIAIPFVLGLLHLLFPIMLWLALIGCIAGSWIVLRQTADDTGPQPARKAGVPYLLVAAVAIVAWPPLMRPVLDGDSVSYHLPNAAAWVHAHGLWTVDPRYWWYPPASELFASALYAVSGPAALPWSGLGPLLLLGFRLYAWAREAFAASPLCADGLAAAVVTATPLALQAGTLQNDVWLAAFFVDVLWCARQRQSSAASRAAAVAALLKPYGIAFVVVGAALARTKARTWMAAFAAFAVWAIHDAVLWKSAIVPPGATSYGNGFDSTIAAHGPGAIALLARVAFAASPFVAVALLAALCGALLARRAEEAGWSALFSLLFYIAMPLGYSGPGPQLATGASLRYASPAIALGALSLLPWVLPAQTATAVALVAATTFQLAKNMALFVNDLPTVAAPGVALLAVALVAAARRLERPWPIAGGIAAAIVVSGVLATRQPVAYYTDELQYGGKSTGLYAWLARRRPSAVAGNGLALGTVNVLVPRARTLDLGDAAPCATARDRDAWLVAVAEPTRTPEFNAARLRSARACGTTLYDDGIAVVTQP